MYRSRDWVCPKVATPYQTMWNRVRVFESAHQWVPSPAGLTSHQSSGQVNHSVVASSWANPLNLTKWQTLYPDTVAASGHYPMAWDWDKHQVFFVLGKSLFRTNTILYTLLASKKYTALWIACETCVAILFARVSNFISVLSLPTIGDLFHFSDFWIFYLIFISFLCPFSE